MARGSGHEAQLSLCLEDSGEHELSPRLPAPSMRRGRRKDQAPGGEAQCQHCGALVPVPDWHRRSGLALHYCGPECRRAWVREQPSFEVRLDHKPRGRGANWEAQAVKARQRDAFTCRVCGVTEEELGHRLDVHHTIPYRGFRSNVEANKLEHLICVCPACHQQVEAQVRRELPLFGQG